MGYSPWGRKRVGHNLATKQQQTLLWAVLSDTAANRYTWLLTSTLITIKEK